MKSAPGALLDIEKIREREFGSIAPTKIVATTSNEQLCLPSEKFPLQEIGSTRAELLRGAFMLFRGEQNDIEAKTESLIAEGIEAIDAIHIAILSSINVCMSAASESNSAYQQAMAKYKALFVTRRYALSASTPHIEMLSLINHGQGVLEGIFEAVPGILRKQNMPVTSQRLKSLIPSSAERLFGALTRTGGLFAIAAETDMGMKEKFLEHNNWDHTRMVFDPDRLMLKALDGQEHIDVTPAVSRAIESRLRSSTHEYYGCIAGLVRMPHDRASKESGKPPPTIFNYLKDFTASLMEKHWFPRVVTEK